MMVDVIAAWSALPDLPYLLLACLIVYLASVVQGALGMGYGLAATPLLALIDPLFVPVPTIMIGCLSATMTAWRERTAIHWDEVGIGMLGRLLGAFGAIAILFSAASSDYFMLVFGFGVALAVVISLLGFVLPLTRLSLVSMGFVSGLMGTVTGVGAPPMALVYQNQKPGAARPTLAAFFAIGCLTSIVLLSAIGWVKLGDFLLSGLMLPAMVLGILTAGRLTLQIDKRYKLALLMVAGLAAVILITRGLQQVL